MGGRISQCLAAEHRQLGCEAARADMKKFVCLVCKTIMIQRVVFYHL